MLVYAMLYHHRFGSDVYLLRRQDGEKPTDEDGISLLEDWEGDTREDEWIDIIGPLPINLIKD